VRERVERRLVDELMSVGEVSLSNPANELEPGGFSSFPTDYFSSQTTLSFLLIHDGSPRCQDHSYFKRKLAFKPQPSLSFPRRQCVTKPASSLVSSEKESKND